MHSYKDPIKRKAANEKRVQTNLERYGFAAPCSPEELSHRVKKGYENQKLFLESLPVLEKEETITLMAGTEFNYLKYFGKAKNRTLLKENPVLYKSLIFYTDELKYLSHRSTNMDFAFRLILVGDYRLNESSIERRFWCRCGKHVLFDPVTQTLMNKGYCKIPGCRIGALSKEHFKYKYEDEWETKYEELFLKPRQTEESKRRHQLAGRIAYFKRKSREDTKFHAVGRNEKELLDKQEKIDNCSIDRCFVVAGFYPDGYCHETNTIYEVYEKYHYSPSQTIKDEKRQEIIQEALNCKFVIIRDDSH